jgi:hypothetical protein
MYSYKLVHNSSIYIQQGLLVGVLCCDLPPSPLLLDYILHTTYYIAIYGPKWLGFIQYDIKASGCMCSTWSCTWPAPLIVYYSWKICMDRVLPRRKHGCGDCFSSFSSLDDALRFQFLLNPSPFPPHPSPTSAMPYCVVSCRGTSNSHVGTGTGPRMHVDLGNNARHFGPGPVMPGVYKHLA